MESGEAYTFYYGFDPVDRMCGLTYHPEEKEPELLGSSVPLIPLEVGKSALLGVDTPSKDIFLIKTPIITSIGPAPVELQPGF